MNEDWMFPPPPPSLKSDRELYRWLTLVHGLLNGIQSGFILSMDSSAATANAAAARAAAAERLASDAALLSAPVREVRDDASILLAPPVVREVRDDAIPAAPVPVIDARALVQEALLLMPPRMPPERYYVRALTADADLRLNEFADVDATGGDVTVTLPNAASNSGRMCGVAKNDSSGNSVIVSGDINGATSATITVQYTALWFISVGTEWRIW